MFSEFSAGCSVSRTHTEVQAPRTDFTKKVLIGIAALAVLFAAPALAADMGAPVAPPPPVPSPVPSPNWAGPYVGLGFGVRYDAVDGNVTSATVGTPPAAIPLPSVSTPEGGFELWGNQPGTMQYLDNIAFRGNFYAGWNYQIAPTYIVGVEGDFGLANETDVFHGSPYPANLLFGSPSLAFGASPNDTFRVTTSWDGSARLRAGWIVLPSTMLYMTGGIAWAHMEATSTCSTAATANVSNCAPGNYFSGTLGPAILTHSGIELGWTGGIGVDVLLSSHWMARAQYRFADFGYLAGTPFSGSDVRACSGCPSAASSPLAVSYQLPMMQHIFEVGLAYKF